MIHPKIEEAFQEIDAAVFSSDEVEANVAFRERLRQFVDRWDRALVQAEQERGCHICGGPDH